MSAQLGDVLSAASLLTTLVALLYSLWYPELSSALGASRSLHLADRDPEIRLVEGALRTKATPLVVATGIQLAVFAPDVAGIIANALTTVSDGLPTALAAYDSLQAAFLAVYAGSGLLAGLAVRAAMQLRAKLASLREP